MTSLSVHAASLKQKLNEAGITTAALSLRGGFHNNRHTNITEHLITVCDKHSAFQFPDDAELVRPSRSNTSGDYIRGSGPLHHTVIRAMLTEQSNWQRAFTALSTETLGPDTVVISFGLERCVPSWLSRQLGSSRLIQVTGLDSASKTFQNALSVLSQSNPGRYNSTDDAIAVIGMSCKLPGADDLEEFWEILCAGRSQHAEAPADRFGNFQTAWRDADPKRKWFANCLRDYDTFDHKFFKKSPREMASTDPQHRLMLQAAYQAVEQSGYFNSWREDSTDRHIGCYIGVGLVDYENNIACYPANAYSATGNLKAFVAGKISHYFGWTGPGLTIDTACSSSAVAVSSACKAILSGECIAALAGGVNVMTSPEWFQNLTGAAFLSPTGQCKPFDAAADGYCRAEGVGAVFLKKLSAAVADGDVIQGVIASSAVFQNQNCTAITVPNEPSLSDLFRHVTRQAGLVPGQVSVVEAHGTGTPVGDPAEYDSVRSVFGGPTRGPGDGTLSLGSVKGLLGHTESASGIVALIKILLMIIKGAIPPQASFHTVNPSLNAGPSDHMEITTRLKPWDVDFRAALINNYGASGSNASMVVTQTPKSLHQSSTAQQTLPLPSRGFKHPFWLGGFDEQALRRYAARLARFLHSSASKPSETKLDISNLSFQLSRQTNRNLGASLIFSCSELSELADRLTAFASGTPGPLTPIARREDLPQRPVVLCFGGQISSFVGLDRSVYEGVTVLRSHLDECDRLCHQLGIGSIYPDIFQRSAISDIVKLQAMLFSMQYACARTWIDCGVRVAAVLGHSFGELTALTISGTLSVQDGLKLVVGRATVIRDSWGEERGSMLAVEADLKDLESLISEASLLLRPYGSPSATIACYNGPRSFTVAGTSAAIEAVRKTASSSTGFASVKIKTLDVTHAFHSSLVDKIMPELERVGRGLVVRDAAIHLERATVDGASPLDKSNISSFAAEHMRNPVYFDHAIRRLSRRYPGGCVWLEAGSNSTITTMASRALGSPAPSHFQPISITSNSNSPGNSSALSLLTDSMVNLWKQGLNVTFWAHHPSQAASYPLLLLPPYQFEKSKHWMDLKTPEKSVSIIPEKAVKQPEHQGLWIFVGYKDQSQSSARFRINTTVAEYQAYVSAHIIAQSAPICPSTYQFLIVVDALASLTGDPKSLSLQPELQGMDSHAPVCMDPSRHLWLDAERQRGDGPVWSWKIVSDQGGDAGSKATLHVTGQLAFKPVSDPVLQRDFARYERLVARHRCLALLDSNETDSVVMQGSRNIYKAFEETVTYNHTIYHGLQKIVGRGLESAGRVIKGHSQETWLDLGLADSFCQVAGIYLNRMADKTDDDDMYISDRIEQWIRSPTMVKQSAGSKPTIWEVLACHSALGDNNKEFVSDVFVFDQVTGQLVEVILGIHYVKVSRTGMGKLLSRLSPSATSSGSRPSPPVSKELPPAKIIHEQPYANGTHHPVYHPQPQQQQENTAKDLKADEDGMTSAETARRVRGLLCNLSGLEPDEVKTDSGLVDLGIDSLMGMELASEIESAFKFSIAMSDLLDLTDFQSLVDCVQRNLPGWKNPAVQVPNSLQNGNDQSHVNGINGVNHNGVAHNGIVGHTNHVMHRNEVIPHVNGIPAHASPSGDGGDGPIPVDLLLDVFSQTKQATDRFIVESKFAGYVDQVIPKSNLLCVVHILDAFAQLGCCLRDAPPGQVLPRIDYLPRHEQVMQFFYSLLVEARLVECDGAVMVRTATPLPTKTAAELLAELVTDYPQHIFDHKLTYLTGSRLADCLVGKADGLQIIFASAEGRDIVSDMYGKSPFNVAWINQMKFLLQELFSRLSQLPKNHEGVIKILELGAGTGGTTASLVPLLAALIPDLRFQYTVTDISSSLVNGARKRFKAYPFVEARVLDIEKEPPVEMLGSQHLIIATNCVHATHNLVVTTSNIHKMLRPDGFITMLEMTKTVPWVDLVFGLLEGWWLFDDGRQHALVPATVWESTMRQAGFGHVDWTDGNRPESSVQRIILGLASSPAPALLNERQDRTVDASPTPAPQGLSRDSADIDARQAIVNDYVERFTYDLPPPFRSSPHPCDSSHTNSSTNGYPNAALKPVKPQRPDAGHCVLITGATGSLGSHLVAHFAVLPTVAHVVCLNRPKHNDASSTITNASMERQRRALESRGLFLDSSSMDKLHVLETHTSQPLLGLPAAEYALLAASVTHIIHNAWPMSLTRPVQSFEGQFRTMRHLLELAGACSSSRRVSFQFVSSVATVGFHPLWTGRTRVPEEAMTVESVLPGGYGEAKLVCELMLEEACRKRLRPDAFRGTVVRVGQVAGSRTSGYWNPVEHLAFVIKSSQTIGALPDLEGDLSWCPVQDVAATMAKLLFLTKESSSSSCSCQIYHIENPTRQPWRDMTRVLADGLGIAQTNIIPFAAWVQRVRGFEGTAEENPAIGLIDFLEAHFVRMSCGGLILDTTRSCEDTKVLRTVGPVGRDLVMKYLDAWKDMKFLRN